MKEEYIIDAFNMLDDAIIAEADEVRSRVRDKEVKAGRRVRDIFGFEPAQTDIGRKSKGMAGWQKRAWYLAGICFVLLICIKTGVSLSKPLPEISKIPVQTLPDETDKALERTLPSETADLPLLTITEDTGEGMGFEGYLAYDISELVNANPWNEDMEIAALPVYQNPIVYKDFCVMSGADFGKMEEFLLEIAERLGMETDNLVITDDAPNEEEQEAIRRKAEGNLPEGYFNPRRLITEAEGIRIEVDVTMSAKLEFDPAIALPDQYHFEEQSYENIVSAAKYLQEEFKDLIGMENPQTDIYDGDYNIYGQQSYGLAFFDKGGTDEENLINYNFNRISFVANEEGGLWIVRIRRPDLSKKAGDYPVINVRQAKELLLNGKYITSVPYEFPGESYIAKAELVYRTGEAEQYYVPYYRFYVEIPEEKGRAGEGMKTYGAYYVPAVESTYISNMPVWDGGFD